MSDLSFSLLGSPVIERGGSPISVDTRKAIALLAYLAVTKQPHRRDTLATLFWPEYDQTHARATLRRTLSSLHKALGSDCLTIEREAIAMQVGAKLQLDVDEFHHLLAESQTHGHAAQLSTIGSSSSAKPIGARWRVRSRGSPAATVPRAASTKQSTRRTGGSRSIASTSRRTAI